MTVTMTVAMTVTMTLRTGTELDTGLQAILLPHDILMFQHTNLEVAMGGDHGRYGERGRGTVSEGEEGSAARGGGGG